MISRIFYSFIQKMSFIALNESIPYYYAETAYTHANTSLVQMAYHSYSWEILYLLYYVEFTRFAIQVWNTTQQSIVFNSTFASDMGVSCSINQPCEMAVSQTVMMIESMTSVEFFQMNEDGVTVITDESLYSGPKTYQMQYQSGQNKVMYKWGAVNGHRYMFCDGTIIMMGDISQGLQTLHTANLGTMSSEVMQVGVVGETFWVAYNETSVRIYANSNWSSFVGNNETSLSWTQYDYDLSVQSIAAVTTEQYFFRMEVSEATTDSNYLATFVAKSSFYRLTISSSNSNITLLQNETATTLLPDTMPQMTSNGHTMLFYGQTTSSFALKSFTSYSTTEIYTSYSFGSTTSNTDHGAIGGNNMVAFERGDKAIRQYQLATCANYNAEGVEGDECICLEYDGAFCAGAPGFWQQSENIIIWALPILCVGLILLTVGTVFTIRKLRRWLKIRHRTPWKYRASQILSYQA